MGLQCVTDPIQTSVKQWYKTKVFVPLTSVFTEKCIAWYNQKQNNMYSLLFNTFLIKIENVINEGMK